MFSRALESPGKLLGPRLVWKMVVGILGSRLILWFLATLD